MSDFYNCGREFVGTDGHTYRHACVGKKDRYESQEAFEAAMKPRLDEWEAAKREDLKK